MPSVRKRLVVALGGAVVLGAVVASAASLGGLTSSSLGANDTVVASCDTDGVSIAYTNTYDATSGRYQVTGATIAGMAAACTGKNISVTLKDAAGASVGSGSAAVTGASQLVAMTPSAGADAVVGAAVVIAG